MTNYNTTTETSAEPTQTPRAGDPIEFREPPPPTPHPHSGTTKAFLAAIAHRPGEWAVMRTGMKAGSAHAAASYNRRNWQNAEFVARKDGDTYSVFARIKPAQDQ